MAWELVTSLDGDERYVYRDRYTEQEVEVTEKESLHGSSIFWTLLTKYNTSTSYVFLNAAEVIH